MVERKAKDGARVDWIKASAQPRIVPPVVGYDELENKAGSGLEVALESANIELIT